MTQRSNRQTIPSKEDDFLDRLANGKYITQDEYDQTAPILPDEVMAAVLAKRFDATQETRLLVESAHLFFRNRMYIEALEVCSRAPNLEGLQQIIAKILPVLRREYPETKLLGKLTEEALLVINLQDGKLTRFPPIMPATSSGEIKETA